MIALIAALIIVALIITLVSLGGGGGDDASNARSTVPSGGTASGGNGSSAAPSGGGPVVTAPVNVDGTALPGFEQTEGDPAVGKAVPELHGSNVLDGSPVDITNDGKPKLIFVVAHWCPHCQREVPLIQDWLQKNGPPAGVELYAVSTAVQQSRGNFPPAKWLSDVHWSVPTIADSGDNTAATALGMTSIPYFVAVDGSGKVVQRAAGEQPISAIQDMIDKLTK
jgi:thiol-disulfide isomerase/thioredoxin